MSKGFTQGVVGRKRKSDRAQPVDLPAATRFPLIRLSVIAGVHEDDRLRTWPMTIDHLKLRPLVPQSR
jgi:hypothetical protein